MNIVKVLLSALGTLKAVSVRCVMNKAVNVKLDVDCKFHLSLTSD